MPLIILSAGVTAVSADASALHSNLSCREVVVAGHLSNTVTLVVGGVSGQALPLWSGTHLRLPTSNVSAIYARSSSTSGLITWIALGGAVE